jgi:hypothetical protein
MQHGLLPALMAEIPGNGGLAIWTIAGNMMEDGFRVHGNSRLTEDKRTHIRMVAT